MIKKLGYYLFAGFFFLFRLIPVQKNKVFMIATHDAGEEGNIGIVAAAIRKRIPSMKIIFLTAKDGIHRPFSFFLGKSYHMATAGTIFLDNEFMPMAFTPISKKVKVVQLWHGTGTIKKFGQDSDKGEVARLAHRANERLTHLIVNSEMTKKQYASAFNMPDERIHILGLPRTDLILDEEKMAKLQEKFYAKYPHLRGKRCTLYAPTFRDDETDCPRIALDLERFAGQMEEDEVLLLRLHPHVAAQFPKDALASCATQIYNMSDYEGTTSLLAISECLITDYSSIVFEYCLLGRCMIFYAYDLQQFEQQGRSFYENYEQFVPGPIAKNQTELENLWRHRGQTKEEIDTFRKQMFAYLDKNATNRLLKLIFEKE